jgi:transporter family protein
VAGCATLTAIFGKLGVEYVNSDFATLLRTVFILPVLAVTVVATGAQQPLSGISRRTYVFLALSALATGVS